MVGAQYFDFLKQAYLINSSWAEHLVQDVEDLDPEIGHRAGFYMKQVINALAPSNWVFTNPELLRETFASDGENLVRGMQFLAEDIKRGGGDPQSGRRTSASSRSDATSRSRPAKSYVRTSLPAHPI